MDAKDLIALIKSESTQALEKKEKEQARLRAAGEAALQMSFGKYLFQIIIPFFIFGGRGEYKQHIRCSSSETVWLAGEHGWILIQNWRLQFNLLNDVFVPINCSYFSLKVAKEFWLSFKLRHCFVDFLGLKEHRQFV